MSQNILNLALRFFLELIALFAMGAWGWKLSHGPLRFVWVILVPLVGALLWAVFRVPGDPGDALVAVPGVTRLLFEALFFGFAIWALRVRFPPFVAWSFVVIVLIHYAVSYDRIVWMLQR